MLPTPMWNSLAPGLPCTLSSVLAVVPLVAAALMASATPPAEAGAAGALAGAISAQQGRLRASQLRVRGNVVFLDEVYQALAAPVLGEVAKVDDASSELLRQRLLGFLNAAGYELASVRVRPEGGRFVVDVDEGRLEKVVWRGRLTVQTVRFKLALNLPHDVFNRPALDREMRSLAAKLGMARAWYELVPTEEVEHLGPQLEQLPTINGHELVKPRQQWELHIFFTEKEWDTGLGLDLRTGYADGLELGVNYQGEHLLVQNDRWRAAASGGAGLRNHLVNDRLYPAFSRAFAEMRWYTPPVFRRARPLLWIRGEALMRQRVDLNIENYWNTNADGSAHLDYEFQKGLHLSLGGGFRWRRLFGFFVPEGYERPPTVGDNHRMRTFALLRTELVFDTEQPRWDRRHQLWAELRHFFALRDPSYGEARAAYQRVWAFGWHDLVVRARGAWLWGEVVFHDEELVSGYHLRAVFAHEWVRRVASNQTEFRFSVTRDQYKVSLFHDVAVFGKIDRYTGAEQMVVGNSFGPGFHALVEGMLQLDLYLAFGFTSDRRFDAGVSVLLHKVF